MGRRLELCVGGLGRESGWCRVWEGDVGSVIVIGISGKG